VTRKWIVACTALTLCAPAGVLSLNSAHQWASSGTAPHDWKARNYIRIALPPVQIIEAELSTDRDAAVILRDSAELSEPQEMAEAGSQIAFGIDPTGQTAVLEQNQAAPIPSAGRSAGFLEVSFDLSRPDMVDRSSLDVRKSVKINGAEAGQATIRVGAGSALFIASEDLRTLLSTASRVDLADRLASGAEQPFLGFDEVRERGLSLRYDAASDRILISG
jgi:hypothetical protein